MTKPNTHQRHYQSNKVGMNEFIEKQKELADHILICVCKDRQGEEFCPHCGKQTVKAQTRKIITQVIKNVGEELIRRYEENKEDVPTDYINTSWTPDEIRHGESFNEGIDKALIITKEVTGVEN